MPQTAGITRTGTLENIKLDEASGVQASQLTDGIYFAHNDDGKPEVFAMDSAGTNLGSFMIEGARNRDWEDMTVVPSESGPLLVLGDTGDNFKRNDTIRLNFVQEPTPKERGIYSGKYPLVHKTTLKYPDGPRDTESIAYDTHSGLIYLMSKRDVPARLYSISLRDALEKEDAVLSFETEVSRFRPPAAEDFRRFGRSEGKWVSQPTGMDINPEGTQAAIITIRSIYLFERLENESWPEAFVRKPVEFIGPSHRQEEAIAYAADGESIIVTAEGTRSPVFRFREIRQTD